MWASMFQEFLPKPHNLLQDILSLVKDILVLINDSYHFAILDKLIEIMTIFEDFSNRNFSPDF